MELPPMSTTTLSQAPTPTSPPSPDRPRRRQLLDLDDCTSAEIADIFETAASMKEVLGRPSKQVPALRGMVVATLFFEEDSHTRLSFELAARTLSANVIALEGGAHGLDRAGSLPGIARQLQALGADILVVRHDEAGAPYLLAQHFSDALINGGDGHHAHPTQALADMFTIHEKLGRLDQLKVVIVGDILHSGVARSHLWGFGTMGAQVTLCAPHTLLGSESFWKATWPQVTISTDIEECLTGADAVISLQLRSERLQEGLLPSLREYGRFFGITAERLGRAAPHCLVLHHGPVREGVELMPDVIASPQSAIADQTRNGVAVRMALLYLLAGA
jgi:aspartate carbamoyltransferase catalytic subunit